MIQTIVFAFISVAGRYLKYGAIIEIGTNWFVMNTIEMETFKVINKTNRDINRFRVIQKEKLATAEK